MNKPQARRALVTGSRDWTNATAIRDALAAEWGDGSAVLVSGACPRGADRIAELFWTRWDGRVERHPADWRRHGRGAGFRRNAEMVNAGADVCLVFIRGGSAGASHTVGLAEAAGIPTRRFEHHHRSADAPTRGDLAVMSYPWIRPSELDAAHAEAARGLTPTDAERAADEYYRRAYAQWLAEHDKTPERDHNIEELEPPPPAAVLDSAAIAQRVEQAVESLHHRDQTARAVLGVDQTPQGVRVQLSSRSHQRAALDTLRITGYLARSDSRANEPGAALLVTGWNTDELRRNARGYAATVTAWEQLHAHTAKAALAAFRDHVERGVAEAEAAAAVAEPARDQWARTASALLDRLDSQLTEQEAAAGLCAEDHALLIRTAGLQAALRELADLDDATEATICLFQQYRDVHGYDDEAAATQALTDVRDAAQAIADMALYQAEDRHGAALTSSGGEREPSNPATGGQGRAAGDRNKRGAREREQLNREYGEWFWRRRFDGYSSAERDRIRDEAAALSQRGHNAIEAMDQALTAAETTLEVAEGASVPDDPAADITDAPEPHTRTLPATLNDLTAEAPPGWEVGRYSPTELGPWPVNHDGPDTLICGDCGSDSVVDDADGYAQCDDCGEQAVFNEVRIDTAPGGAPGDYPPEPERERREGPGAMRRPAWYEDYQLSGQDEPEHADPGGEASDPIQRAQRAVDELTQRRAGEDRQAAERARGERLARWHADDRAAEQCAADLEAAGHAW